MHKYGKEGKGSMRTVRMCSLAGRFFVAGMIQAVCSWDSAQAAQGFVVEHTCTNISLIPDDAIARAANYKTVLCGDSLLNAFGSGFTQLKAQNPKYNWTGKSFILRYRGHPGAEKICDDLGVQDLKTNAPGGYIAHCKNAYNAYCIYVYFGERWTNQIPFPADDTAPFAGSRRDWAYYSNAMVRLEQAYPNNVFVWSTIPPFCAQYKWYYHAGSDFKNGEWFNANVRAFCKANNRVLYDFADILSHDGAGNRIVDKNGYESMCYDWCGDDGEHPAVNAGPVRLATTWWWLAARLTGWTPVPQVSAAPVSGVITTAPMSAVTLPNRPALVAWYPLEDNVSQTELHDATTNAHNGTLFGSIASSADCMVGSQAYAFNGGQAVVYNSISSEIRKGLTLCAWVKIPDTNGVYCAVWEKDAFSLYATGPGNRCAGGEVCLGGMNYSVSSGRPLAVNAWQHLAVTCDPTAGQLLFYINGAKCAAKTVPPGGIDTSYSELYVGNHANYGVYRGLLDDVRIYNYALKAQDLYALYTGTNTVRQRSAGRE